jgi:hypothetical protein
MDNAAAFKATFHNTKLVMGRSVLQIILEVPIEQQKQVYDALGYPNPANTTWVGVARLQEPEAQ